MRTEHKTKMVAAVAIAVAMVSSFMACSRSQTPDEAVLDDAVPETVAEDGVRVAKLGDDVPDFTLPDLDGETHTISDYRDSVVVLEWINKDCPFVKKHYSVDALQALQREYTAQGVVWLAICSSAPGKQGHFDIPTWKRRAEESKMAPTAILLDPDGTVGRAYGATHTPHMYVIDTDGTLAYAGAIDDDRSTDSSKVAGAHNYVVAALNAVLGGEGQVETPLTRPYGCTVKY